MKKLLVIFAALIFAATLPAQTQPDVIARIHFLGGDKISTDKNSAAFANEFSSPQARALENQTLDKLAKFFASQLKSANDAPQLRPLLDDLLKSEWIFEMRNAPGSPEYALAIRLGNGRAQAWNKNLPSSLKVSRANEWTIINFGEKFSPQISIATNWLSADLNWPRLAQLFPALREFDFPKIAFQVVGRDGNFHWTGKLNLSQPLPPLTQWRVPTNELHQPFVSFTAARGISPWLQKQSWFQPYVLRPQPDQIFVWALPMVPFQTFAAESVPNASAALTELHDNLAANQNWQSQFMMPIRLTLTNSTVVTFEKSSGTRPKEIKTTEKNGLLSFAGIPFVSPFIRADHEANGDFLFGGFFPNTPRSKPLPPELFQQLNTPNLVYYHWEITSERLKELPELSQLLLMMTQHRQLPGGSMAQRWLTNCAPHFGSSVMTVTETSPTELSFARKASGGLTAVELIALANWLEAPDFPVLDLKLPKHPRLRPGMRPKTSAAPMPLMSVPQPRAKK